MQSFSARTKEELCRELPGKRCCAVAEAYGVLLFCNQFTPQEIRVVTECIPFARRLPRLFHKAFGVSFDQLPDPPDKPGKRILAIHDPAALRAIWDAFGYQRETSVALHINYGLLEEACDRAAFFRGAFLTGGSVTDPEKRYHLELATSHYHVSRELQALLPESGLRPKETTRKANYITYFKQSEAIEDFLTTIGAPLAAMEVMNAKVEKHLRNGVNRRVNCDSANLDKSVVAAMEQINALRRLERSVGLEGLPDKLRETAHLRMEHPELSLAQLAELCHPPVSKSCLNHRLRKLMELAGTLPTDKEEPPS